MTCRMFRTAAMLALVTASAIAQVAYVNPVGGAVAGRVFLPSALVPGGGPAPVPPFPLPIFGACAGAAVLPIGGGMAVDQRNGFIYNTDGFCLTIDANPLYPAPGILPAPFPVFGLVTPNLPITGLGFNANVPALLMSSPNAFQFRAPLPPYGPLGPVVAVPTLAPITGCDYDPADNTIWLCDAAANVYHLTIGGLPIGPQPVAVVPIPGPAIFPALTGLAINRSNGAASFPPPFCSTQLPGYHVLVTNGFLIADALGPNPFIPTGVPGPSYGLAFSSDCEIMPGSGAPTNVANIGINRPAHNAFVAPPMGVYLNGAFPAQLAILCFDLCPVPLAFPMPWGGALSLDPATLIVSVTATDAAGNAVVPIPAAGAPAGVQFSCQWVYGHPFNPPFFLSHSDVIEVSLGVL